MAQRKGYKHTQQSKDQIAKSKTGYKHTEETKDKISCAVRDWWFQQRRIDEDILYDCRYLNYEQRKEVGKWLEENKDDLNFPDVLSASEIRSKTWRERPSIERFSSKVTPLFLLLVKEEAEAEEARLELLFRKFDKEGGKPC